MNVLPPTNTPNDMLLLLGKLDGKLDGIATTLGAMNQRADNHETRIHTLEQSDAERRSYVPRFLDTEKDVSAIKSRLDQESGKRRGWFEAGGAVKMLLLAIIAALGYVGYRVEIAPDVSKTSYKVTTEATSPIVK